MKVVNCPLCGGSVVFDEIKNHYICEYCESLISAEPAKDDHIQQLKDRANRLFLACDFEGASALYQNVVSQSQEDAEAYWLLAMCAYGIQYVEDPLTGKRVPTCNRTLYAPILRNEDYLNALEYADDSCRAYYEKTAKQIDEIQKEIKDIVEKEDPYDIFLSYKETDENGMRTREGDVAKDLYYKLIANKYRVFYAPETLKSIAGHKYEPYIFAALNSAKLFVCIGFSAKHFNAPWVKNEWSRFLARMGHNNKLRMMICFNSYLMNGSEIPEQLAKMQATDLSNTSTNDLVNQIGTILPKAKKQEQAASTNAGSASLGDSANALCKRGFFYLEDRQFKEAASYFNKCLDQNPELSKAYWGMMLADFNCCNDEELYDLGKPLEENNEYKKALRFGSGAEQDAYLEVSARINKKIQTTLNQLTQKQADVLKNTDIFSKLVKTKNELEEQQTILEKHLAEIFEKEKEIEKSVEQCDQVLKPFTTAISNVQKSIRKLIQNSQNVNAYTNAEYKELDGQINALRNELTANAEKIKQSKQNEPCFSNLSKQVKRQNELKTLLDQDYENLARIHKNLKQTQDQLIKILNEFCPSWGQVKKGDYSLSNALLKK